MTRTQTIAGRFLHLIYSPKGSIEGVLLDIAGQRAQVVFAHHDDVAPLQFDSLSAGQALVVEAELQGASPKGAGDHAVYAFGRLKSIDGAKPAKPAAADSGYAGRVVRFNYARHGAANGVVLDTGDFIHTKPDGMARLGLKVGDRVVAEGDAHQLATGNGWAVEAVTVNRKQVKVH